MKTNKNGTLIKYYNFKKRQNKNKKHEERGQLGKAPTTLYCPILPNHNK